MHSLRELAREHSKVKAIQRLFAITPGEIAILVVPAVLFAVFEGFGIGMLLPVLQCIQAGFAEALAGDLIWGVLVRASNAAGVPANPAALLTLAFILVILRQIKCYLGTWYSATGVSSSEGPMSSSLPKTRCAGVFSTSRCGSRGLLA